MRLERGIILAALVIVSALSWWYTVYLAQTMDCCAQFGVIFVMWAVMMVAMMVPTAVPMVLVFALVNRKRHEQAKPYVPTAFFVLGYVIVWTVFSLLMTFLQEWLKAHALMSSRMVLNSPLINGSFLIMAGIFQWTPLKTLCLTHCRSPFDFMMTQWRQGPGGAVMMGLRHGTFCLGCCWFLMLLLFVGGVMNIAWVIFLTVFVLAEKAFAHGPMISRAAGAAFIALGLITLLGKLS